MRTATVQPMLDKRQIGTPLPTFQCRLKPKPLSGWWQSEAMTQDDAYWAYLAFSTGPPALAQIKD